MAPSVLYWLYWFFKEAFTNAIEMQQFVGNIQGEMYYDDIVDASFASEVVQ